MTARLEQRVALASLPTPLLPLPRLGAALGLPELWIKRDDLTDVAGGGNKLRKLEYFVAEAKARGATVLVTYGKLQSNHARCTAAAAARCGLRCIVLYQDVEPERRIGNAALVGLLGAELRFLGDVDALAVNAVIRGLVRELEAQGTTAFAIPEGGGNPIGALGFVAAARELAEQCQARGHRPDVVVLPVGSAGSLAGLALGFRRFLAGTRLVGISVGPAADALAKRAAQIANQAANLIAVEERFAPRDFEIHDAGIGAGYGAATEEADTALLLASRLEGILLDPVYTAKAMAGLAGLVRRSVWPASARVLFWHTGGFRDSSRAKAGSISFRGVVEPWMVYRRRQVRGATE